MTERLRPDDVMAVRGTARLDGAMPTAVWRDTLLRLCDAAERHDAGLEHEPDADLRTKILAELLYYAEMDHVKAGGDKAMMDTMAMYLVTMRELVGEVMAEHRQQDERHAALVEAVKAAGPWPRCHGHVAYCDGCNRRLDSGHAAHCPDARLAALLEDAP